MPKHLCLVFLLSIILLTKIPWKHKNIFRITNLNFKKYNKTEFLPFCYFAQWHLQNKINKLTL